MKRIIKYMLFAAVAVASAGLSSCVKAYENEKVEIIERPQIDIEPAAPDWDDQGTETID